MLPLHRSRHSLSWLDEILGRKLLFEDTSIAIVSQVISLRHTPIFLVQLYVRSLRNVRLSTLSETLSFFLPVWLLFFVVVPARPKEGDEIRPAASEATQAKLTKVTEHSVVHSCVAEVRNILSDSPRYTYTCVVRKHCLQK